MQITDDFKGNDTFLHFGNRQVLSRKLMDEDSFCRGAVEEGNRTGTGLTCRGADSG